MPAFAARPDDAKADRLPAAEHADVDRRTRVDPAESSRLTRLADSVIARTHERTDRG
jgi:hypothetical protein